MASYSKLIEVLAHWVLSLRQFASKYCQYREYRDFFVKQLSIYVRDIDQYIRDIDQYIGVGYSPRPTRGAVGTEFRVLLPSRGVTDLTEGRNSEIRTTHSDIYRSI